jgi:hypothetical protein
MLALFTAQTIPSSRDMVGRRKPPRVVIADGYPLFCRVMTDDMNELAAKGKHNSGAE